MNRNYSDFDLRLNRPRDYFFINKPTNQRTEPESFPHLIPLVKKIAVARPLYFTGNVKTLIFLFSDKNYSKNFSDFDEYNDVNFFAYAKTLGKVINHHESEEIEYCEFEKDAKNIYPVLWVQFKT